MGVGHMTNARCGGHGDGREAGVADTSLALGAYAAVFAPVDARGRAAEVTRRLGEAISMGLLPDGSPLPSESELAERMGIATVTVREALGSLRDDGLITTRRGRSGGSFVVAPGDGGRAALQARLLDIGLGELRDLVDHYAAINGMAAELAAERGDEDDVRRLRALAPLCRDAPSQTARRRGEANFHVEVAAVAQSARLTREEMALQGEVGLLLWISHEFAGSDGSRAGHHGELVDAIAGGDADAARRVAEAHVREMMNAARVLHHQARARSQSRSRRGTSGSARSGRASRRPGGVA